MGRPPAGAVVVATGSSGHRAAVRWAVEEARRTRRPLHLLRVVELPADDAFAAVRESPTPSLEAVLADARRSVAGASAHDAPELPLSVGVVETGWATGALLADLEDASLLVLQRSARRDAAPPAVPDAAVRTGTAVVSVPAQWAPGGAPPTVVVAVRDPGEATELVRAGLRAARPPGAVVVVLHAWSTPPAAATSRGPDHHHPLQQARAELEKVLQTVRTEHPGIEVKVHLRRSTAEAAVLTAADTCSLLVLGPPREPSVLGHRGEVTRVALAHPTCPVLTCRASLAPSTRGDTLDGPLHDEGSP